MRYDAVQGVALAAVSALGNIAIWIERQKSQYVRLHECS